MSDTPGARIRTLRETRGMTVRELAAATGYSPSAVSRYEGGSRTLTVAAARRIAPVFGITPAELLGLETPPVRVEPERFVRHGIEFTRLTRAGLAGGLQVVRAVYEPGQDMPEPNVHPGHEWLFVLQGSIELQVDGRSEQLVAGDAAEFDTGRPHAMRCAGTQPAVVLVVLDERGMSAHQM